MSLREEIAESIASDPYHSYEEIADIVTNKVLDKAVEAVESTACIELSEKVPNEEYIEACNVAIKAIQRLKEGK